MDVLIYDPTRCCRQLRGRLATAVWPVILARDVVRPWLLEAGASTMLAHLVPLHLQPVRVRLKLPKMAWPACERLPVSPHLSAARRNCVIERLLGAVGGLG
jgi:hypothetical protein